MSRSGAKEPAPLGGFLLRTLAHTFMASPQLRSARVSRPGRAADLPSIGWQGRETLPQLGSPTFRINPATNRPPRCSEITHCSCHCLRLSVRLPTSVGNRFPFPGDGRSAAALPGAFTMTEPADDRTPLSEAQLEIMNLVWDQGEVTVADVWKALAKRRKLARNTMQTMIVRLEEKGWLTMPDQGTCVPLPGRGSARGRPGNDGSPAARLGLRRLGGRARAGPSRGAGHLPGRSPAGPGDDPASRGGTKAEGG